MYPKPDVTNLSGLSLSQLADLEERLRIEKAKVTGRLAGRRDLLGTPSGRDPDDGDWASDSADQGLLARLVDRDTKLLHEIDRALTRIADGSYGVCEVSGEPIGFDRLAVRPWTRQAVAVKELAERQDRARATPELSMDLAAAG